MPILTIQLTGVTRLWDSLHWSQEVAPDLVKEAMTQLTGVHGPETVCIWDSLCLRQEVAPGLVKEAMTNMLRWHKYLLQLPKVMLVWG